ncbi:R8 protein [Rhodotorula kratochvilovae]
MFYNTEILTSRKGGFGVFWLAATVGARGSASVRKLSKKELLGCNIVKACEKVIQPDEPLALRLSSNLMFGITRVYSQQYAIYAGDVAHVHQALRKVITDAALTMRPTGPAKETGIDLQLNPYAGGVEPDWELGLDWFVPGQAGAAAPAAPEDLEEAVFTSPAQSIFGSPLPQGRQPGGAHQAREADITLHEPQMHDYFPEEYGGDEGFRVEGFEGEQLGGPAFGEGEEGLLEGVHPDLDAAIRAGSAGRGSAAGSGSGRGGQQWGPSSSAVGYEADFGGFDGHFDGHDFGGDGYMDEQPLPQGGEETFAERVRREQEEGRARLEGGSRRSPTPLGDVDFSREFIESGEGTPSSTTRKRVSNALDLAQAKAEETEKTARKAKKAKLVPIDRSTELDDGLFKAMRASYPDRMQAERDLAERKKRDGEAHQRAMDLVFGAPAFLEGPDLSEFWKSTIADQLVPFDGGKAAEEKKRRASGLPPTERKSKRLALDDEVARKPGERLSEQPGQAAATGDFAQEDVFAGHEFGGGIEYGGDLGGFEHFHFDQEVEQGRAGSAAGLTGSQRPSILPWAAEVPTSDVGGPLMGMAGPSSGAGGSRISMEAPVPGGRTPSLLHSPARAGSIEGLLAEQEGEFAGFEEGALSRSPSPFHSQGAGAAPAVEPGLRETESLKFLAYARRQQREGEELLFSDIVPVADTNANTAAQALYHLLCLATKGLVGVTQDEAYGEITVEIR